MTILFNQLANLVVRPTLAYLGLDGAAAVNLVLGTAAQETGCQALAQFPTGPARGIWQIEPATHRDVLDNFLAFRPELRARVDGLVYPGADRDTQLTTNLVYACAIARLIYLRAPDPLPPANDLNALAAYWKRFYNTAGGGGTVEDFTRNFTLHVGAPINA